MVKDLEIFKVFMTVAYQCHGLYSVHSSNCTPLDPPPHIQFESAGFKF